MHNKYTINKILCGYNYLIMYPYINVHLRHHMNIRQNNLNFENKIEEDLIIAAAVADYSFIDVVHRRCCRLLVRRHSAPSLLQTSRS